jgi:hypothetical protein
VQTWLVAIVGGVVGSVVTAALALGAQFVRARDEIASHDRFVADRDEDLASWVSDRSLALRRELAAKTEELNKENLYGSSTHGEALALLKERALHEYRDQERRRGATSTSPRRPRGGRTAGGASVVVVPSPS